MTNESIQVRRARERAEAKAKNKQKITPFFRMTTQFDANGLPEFATQDLTQKQREFLQGCERAFVKVKAEKPEEEFNFAMVYYKNETDLGGTMIEAKDVAEAEREFQKIWDGEDTRRGYPRVGDELTREDLAEKSPEAVFSFDLLKEGHRWAWPNAKSVFEKKGDRLVCIEEI